MQSALQKIRDQLHYNALCAPHEYPEEDRTSLAREESELIAALRELYDIAHSESRKAIAQGAVPDVNRAFAFFANGDDARGRRALESVLDALVYFEADKLPETGFVVTPDGDAVRVSGPLRLSSAALAHTAPPFQPSPACGGRRSADAL